MAEIDTEKAIAAIRNDFNRLRGRLFGSIEATGMAKKQEDAVKHLIRQQTYEAQANLESHLRKNGANAHA
jgi:hypothetical protein